MAMQVTATINCRLTFAGTTNHYKLNNKLHFIFLSFSGILIHYLYPTLSLILWSINGSNKNFSWVESSSFKNTHPNLTHCEEGPVAALPWRPMTLTPCVLNGICVDWPSNSSSILCFYFFLWKLLTRQHGVPLAKSPWRLNDRSILNVKVGRPLGLS